GAARAERADHPRDVAREGHRVVAERGLVRGARAAQVHRGDPVPRLGEHGDLVAPRPPALADAVQEHDEGRVTVAGAREGDVEARTVRGHELVPPRSLDENARRVNCHDVGWVPVTASTGSAGSMPRRSLGGSKRYPTLRTVPISCSCSVPSFARSRRTCTSTVRVPPK